MTHATIEKHSQLEESISTAMKKVGVTQESELCKYIPVNNERIHHFAFAKMKRTNPSSLKALLQKHIHDKDSPSLLPPKKRLFQTRAKRTVDIKFNRAQVNRLTSVLQGTEHADLLDMLKPYQSLAEIQRQLIASIRERQADYDLWNSYLSLLPEKTPA